MAKRNTQPAAQTATKKTRNVPSWKERNVKKAESTLAWLSKLEEDLNGGGISVEDVVSARTYLSGINETLAELPTDWKPASKAKRNGALGVGDSVQLRDDAEGSYSFIRDFDKRVKGAVIASAFDKQSVIVQLNDGEKTLVQKRHLQRAAG